MSDEQLDTAVYQTCGRCGFQFRVDQGTKWFVCWSCIKRLIGEYERVSLHVR